MEALIAMAVIAILVAVAVPAWSRARAAANTGLVRANLASSILDAVRHAAIAGSEVVVCPARANGCDRSTSWDNGWLVFADINGNRAPDPNETRLASRGPLPDEVHLRTTAGRTKVVFQPSGGNAGSNVTYTLCDSRGPKFATTLVLSNTGHMRTGQPTAAAAWNCVYGN
jgi:type IV fimbrial biogenesis protein FimT